jgi:chaperone protein EcpD
MNIFNRATCALAMAFAGAFGVAHAGTQINGTRVIYPAGESEVSVSVVNNDKSPRLLQAWVDSGNPDEKPENSKAPFVITPPMSRVDPGKGQTFRLMYTGAPLPQDRESVFWLNVLEIPPKPKAAQGDSNDYLQFAVRTRIKIFFRPKGLVGNPNDAIDQLIWRVTRAGQGYAAECINNTSFNVSFSDVSFKNAPQNKSIAKGGMCPALGKASFAITGVPDSAEGKLSLSAINDFGGFEPREAGFAR